MPTVTSRVVAEIYRGIDFPVGWADKPDVINIGMARDLLISVAAMFDADRTPLAVCWQIDSREERFAYAQPSDPDGSSPLDELHRDLGDESSRLGAADLLATMVWTPDEVRPDQGQSVEKVTFVQGRYGGTRGWNVATRTLVASAGNLLFQRHRIDQNLAFPMPTTIENMHQQMGNGDSQSTIVLPGSIAVPPEANVGRNVLLFFLGLIALAALTTAYLVNSGR